MDYFEEGHGKGPCDGIDATVKRLAHDAVKIGSFKIADAYSFYSSDLKSKMTFFWKPKEEINAAEDEMKIWEVQPVSGCINIHAVVRRESIIFTTEISCFKQCRRDESKILQCESWYRR